ncbi:MAG: PAS domain-containing protein [Planctomycetota bacterium]|jgi:PAS domain S-box-containing protein
METKNHKILLIEDDKVDQMAFQRFVEKQQLPYSCTIAGSISDAKDKLTGNQFDAVISDYSLGDGNAFDVLGLVKDIPVILVTGAGDEEIAVKAWRAGAYDYLTKDTERHYLKALPITLENAIKHKKTEDKLHLLSQAMMSTDDSVFISDMASKIIFVNRAFCKTYGYSREEIIGEDNNILWVGKDQTRNTRSVFSIPGSALEVGFYHRKKDNGIFPVSLCRSIIKDPNGTEIAVVGVARDISDRVQVEDELRGLNVQLMERNRLKSELSAMVSDAMTTLLAALSGMVDDAKQGFMGKVSPQLSENLNTASDNITKAQDIVSKFLDASKTDTNEMKLEQTRNKLEPLVAEIINELAPVLEEKNNKTENA